MGMAFHHDLPAGAVPSSSQPPRNVSLTLDVCNEGRGNRPGGLRGLAGNDDGEDPEKLSDQFLGKGSCFA